MFHGDAVHVSSETVMVHWDAVHVSSERVMVHGEAVHGSWGCSTWFMVIVREIYPDMQE